MLFQTLLVWKKKVKWKNHLFSLNKVGHLSIIISSPNIEACASSLWAEAGEDAGLGLFVSCIYGADLHATTHQPQQPVVAVHAVVFQVQVQRLVPIDSTKCNKNSSKS